MVKHKAKKVEVEEKTVYPLQYKSNLEAIGKLIQSLTFTSAHLEMLKRTPFWHIFKQWICKEPSVKLRKTDENICAIIKKYDADKKAFMLAKKKVRFSEHDIALIFGVSSGNELMDLAKTSKPEHLDFVSTRFKEEKIMKSKNIKAALAKAMHGDTENDIADVAKLLTLYIYLTLFFSTSGDMLSWGFIKYVSNVDAMRNYNWSRAIASNLMESVKKYVKNPVKVTGCVSALTYWFCEHTTIFKPVDKTQFPRFLKWDLKKWPRKDFDKIYIDKLKKSQVISGELESTNIEERLHASDYLSSGTPCLSPTPNISSIPSASGCSINKVVDEDIVGDGGNVHVIEQIEEQAMTDTGGAKRVDDEDDYIADGCHECRENDGRHYSTPEVSEELREQPILDFSTNNMPNIVSEQRTHNRDAVKELRIARNELEEALKQVKNMDRERNLEKQELEQCKAALNKEMSEKELLKIQVRDLEAAILAANIGTSELSVELQNLRNKMLAKENSVLAIAKEIDRSELTMEIDILKSDKDEIHKELERQKGLVLQIRESNAALEVQMQLLKDEKMKVDAEKNKLEEELRQILGSTAATEDFGGEMQTMNHEEVRSSKRPNTSYVIYDQLSLHMSVNFSITYKKPGFTRTQWMIMLILKESDLPISYQ